MTSKADKAAIKLIIAKHVKHYGAPLGKRKCKYEVTYDCFGIAADKHFEGHMCKACVSFKQNESYRKRMAKREQEGNPVRNGPGRPRKDECKVKKGTSKKMK